MSRHIIKVEKTTGSLRVVIPRKLVNALRWRDVAYVFIESDNQGRIVIRRLLDDQALKENDKGNKAK